MKIGIVVNHVKKEANAYTTTGLALAASRRGHEIYYISAGDFMCLQDNHMAAHARKAPTADFKDNADLLDAVKAAEKTTISSKELDVLLLRSDPAEDEGKRPWAQHAGIVFGNLAKARGVLVLNNPETLAHAVNKMYFQYFPQSVRPDTLITRDVADIRSFYLEKNKKIIVKPLQGSGGKDVFLINEQTKNLNQIVEAISRDGFVVAQEYLPEATEGDTRLFLLNGKPIVVNGHYAGIHRKQSKNDIRSNIHQGGEPAKPEVTKQMLEIVEIVSPKLIEDGMFLVGLDIVGNKLMEVNVFSPGGFGHASKLQGVDFFLPVIQEIEKMRG